MIRNFSPNDAKGALAHFKRNGVEGGHEKGIFKPGMVWGRSDIDADTALERLQKGKEVQIADREDDYYELHSLDELKVLDDLLGRKEGFALTADQSAAIMDLESGSGEKDGIYDPGFIFDSKKDAFTAAQELLDGGDLNIRVGNDEDNAIHSFEDIEELSAFQGAGKNTILPQAEFDAMVHYQDQGSYQIANSEDQKAFDALNSMQGGKSVGINSRGRTANAASSTDIAELHAMEGGGQSDDPSIEKLLYFEGQGGEDAFLVGGRETFAYESLQRIQAGRSVEVEAAGAHNTVRSAQDLSDLDSLLGRKQNSLLEDAPMQSLENLTAGIGEGGMYQGSSKLGNVYSSYKAIENADITPEYRFQGGDYNETLAVPVGSFADLGDVQLRVENQLEYDRYGFSESEMQDKYSALTGGLEDALNSQIRGASEHVGKADGRMQDASSSVNSLKQSVRDIPATIGELSNSIEDLSGGRGIRSTKRDLELTESQLRNATRTNDSVNADTKAVNDGAKAYGDTVAKIKAKARSASNSAPGQPANPAWDSVLRAVGTVERDLEALNESLADLSKLEKSTKPVFNNLEQGVKDAKAGIQQTQEEAPRLQKTIDKLEQNLSGITVQTEHWGHSVERAGERMTSANEQFRGLDSQADPSATKSTLEIANDELRTADTDASSVETSLADAPEYSSTLSKKLGNISSRLQSWPEKREKIDEGRADMETELRFAERLPRQIERDLRNLQASARDLSAELGKVDKDTQADSDKAARELKDLNPIVSRLEGSIGQLGEDTESVFESLGHSDEGIQILNDDVARLKESSDELGIRCDESQGYAKLARSNQSNAAKIASGCIDYLDTLPADQEAVAELSASLDDIESSTLQRRYEKAQHLQSQAKGELNQASGKIVGLLESQMDRPERPADWVEPFPRVQ